MKLQILTKDKNVHEWCLAKKIFEYRGFHFAVLPNGNVIHIMTGVYCGDNEKHFYGLISRRSDTWLGNSLSKRKILQRSCEYTETCEACGEQYIDYCKECEVKCSRCDETEKRDNYNGVFTDNGDYYCEDCMDDLLWCDKCELYHDKDADGEEIGDSWICDDCLNKHYTKCDYCGNYVAGDTVTTDGGDEICENCYMEYYFTCNECGGVFSLDNSISTDDGLYCDHCNPRGIHEYTYTPEYKFYGKKGPYFGFELEVAGEENPPNICREEIYLKSDASIGEGFEIVSHPWAWDHFPKYMEKILLTLQKNEYRSYDTTTCGMHVHVSKDSFSGLHLFKFLSFYYNNPGFITAISQRKPDRLEKWASLTGDNEDSIVYKAKTKRGKKRYCAVNLTNTHTVEIRIFRGTLVWQSFCKNLEFIKATYDYTLQASLKDVSVDSFKAFVAQSKEYKNLHKFIIAKEL